jgi:mannose-1-phosphate guanylyltransferase
LSQAYVVIMAGGRGERLWPLSTPERPKQFLGLFGNRTMLQQTVDLVLPLVPLERILIVTSAEHVALVQEQLPELPPGNVVGEPAGRGTAACVALAAFVVQKASARAVMVALPADHIIEDVDGFRQLMGRAIAMAALGNHLVTLGIEPSRPETGYGYIHAPHEWIGEEGPQDVPSAREVNRFTEKPDRETAERFLREGTYYWNSGMFVWRVDTVLEEIRTWMPNLHQAMSGLRSTFGTAEFQEALGEAYAALESASIDRGVMEKCARILLLPASGIGWSDVGGWEALREAMARREKPWGYEHLWALSEHYAGKFLHIRAGESLSLQYHEIKDETIHILQGKLRLRIGPSQSELLDVILSPGQSQAIPPGTIHQMEALEDCVIAEVSTPHLTDVVRLEDKYGRAIIPHRG